MRADECVSRRDDHRRAAEGRHDIDKLEHTSGFEEPAVRGR
jgi:hypothetical protein